MLRILTASLLVSLTSASFCGDSTIPFSLEILPDGQPILGCARPSCFGWSPSGQPATNNAYFNAINNQADGFVRNGTTIPAYGPDDARYYRPQTAMCEKTFTSASCSRVDQWVGGIAPLLNVTQYRTRLSCCTFEELLRSEEQGIAAVHAGQIAVGGEVVSSGIQVGFDYISDISKEISPDGTLQYNVALRRMSCLDTAGTNTGTYNGYSTNYQAAAAQAFQAPNVAVDQPIPLPPSAPVSENAIVEEASNAIQSQVNGPQGPQGPVQQQGLVPQDPNYGPQGPQGPQAPPTQYQQYQEGCQAPATSGQYYQAVAFSGCGTQFCFTDDMTVELMDGSKRRMDELKKTDWVLAVNNEELQYVQVEFWLHRVPAQEAEFNEFETEDGRTIKLTDKHYIYKGDCSRIGAGPVPYNLLPTEAVTADQVHAGDCLFTLGADRHLHEVRVIRTGRVKQQGIYAPMTSTGRILVNGVHASCHNIMQEHLVGHSFFEYVAWWNQLSTALFGVDTEEIVETPTGLTTLIEMTSLIVPKNIFSM